MDLRILPVGVDYVAQTWPFVETYLGEALTKGESTPDWSDNYDLSHIQGFLTSGVWTLIVATDDNNQVHGAATVSFANYPKNRVAFITLIGGKLISSKDTFEQLSIILRNAGATKIQGMARPAIARLWKRYGFEERTTLVEVKL
jgi:hypothetical protein